MLTTGEDIGEGIGDGIDEGDGVGFADSSIGGDGMVLQMKMNLLDTGEYYSQSA